MEDESVYQVKKSKAIKFEDNATYQRCSLMIIKDVTFDDLRIMVDLFLRKASNNMGNEFNENTVESVLDFLKTQFYFLPVYAFASCVVKGSLGHYGAGRLVPRTIFGWTNEASQEFRRKEEHNNQMEQLKERPISFDLFTYPVGKAINKKIDWLVSGAITEADWDLIPMKEVADRIAQGLPCVPELFGVETKNKEQ
jgi:hypothetical protein